MDELPFGTRGGVAVTELFSAGCRVRISSRPGRRGARAASTRNHRGWRAQGHLLGDAAVVAAEAGRGGGACRPQFRIAVKAGPQADRRHVRAAHRGAGRRHAPSAAAQPRHAAGRSATVTIRGPYNAHRSGRYAEPRADFRVPSAERRGGDAPARSRSSPTLMRRAYRRPVTDADLADADAVLRNRAQGRDIRSRDSDGARTAAGQPAVSVSHRARSGRTQRQARRIGSAIWNWPRGFRSSCGAAFRTTNC